MKPKEVLQKFVEAFNNTDPDALAELYSNDAFNHQVAASFMSLTEKLSFKKNIGTN
jgi:hypothetical protein